MINKNDPFGGLFRGKTVLVTGHTGFKGSWLSAWLLELGADVAGLALQPEARPNLFTQLRLERRMASHIADIRDSRAVARSVAGIRPQIVFHLAAQPLVLEGYREPAKTFATNVMGTANVLDAARRSGGDVRVCVIVTTDKCYEPGGAAHREDDRLGGVDPYSASKACAELTAGAYRASFFAGPKAASISTARAGNVVGGGDWARHRLVPDCMRAFAAGRPVTLRHPGHVRPWQHVLDPLAGYLWLAARQWAKPQAHAEAWNFGPDPRERHTAKQVVARVARLWGGGKVVEAPKKDAPYESPALALDCAKARRRLGWRPVYDLEDTLVETVRWYRAHKEGGDSVIAEFTVDQIDRFTRVARDQALPWA